MQRTQAMSLQGYWKLAASPSSSVSKSVASLFSCLLLRAAAAPSPRSCIALSASFHHALRLPLGCRRFCWVRRTPPFPRNAAPKASAAQDMPCAATPLSLAGESHLRFTDTGHVLFSDVAAVGFCEARPSASETGYRPCDVGDANAFRSSSDGDADIVNGPDHPCDINARVHVAASCIIPGPCDATTIGGIDTAPQSIIGPSAPPGLVESFLDSSSLSNATLRSHKGASGLQLTKTGSPKCPQLRRMLNSNHAVIKDLKDEKTQWFPYLDQFKVKDQVLISSQIIQMLGSFMLEDRRDRIKRVVANRTYAICIVVEGLLDLGNIAAIFRSADALGFQSVQVISNETERRYKKNRRISMGSEKWLDAELFNVTEDCFEELRARGYRVAVASVAADSVPIFDVDWTIPTAVVFGNEYRGVSREALQMADFSCYIPMEGMVDSFNVSVAAGIVMHHAVNDRKARRGQHGDLSEEEQRILSADFYLRHSSRSLSVIDRLLQKKQEERQTDLKSVLMGDLELDIELPEYLKLDLEKVCSEFNPA